MRNKRLIAVITVRQGWAVQSFGYGRYLPLGRPEVLAENFDRWGADEILLQCIDRSASALGPDLAMLRSLGRMGLTTPLIYAGGIRNVDEACAVVREGADRVVVDALLQDVQAPQILDAIAAQLGAQAVIAAMPMSVREDALLHYDHRRRQSLPISAQTLAALNAGAVSEVLVIDWQHEGQAQGFDARLIQYFPTLPVSLIAFGGLSEPSQLAQLLALPQVSACAMGNFLAYREHAIDHFRRALPNLGLRAPMTALGVSSHV